MEAGNNKMHALIVDSSVSSRAIISMMLNRHDIDVTETSSGRSALQYLQKNSFELLIFSSQLEDIAGIEFYRQYKKSNTSHLPISLLVTASTQQKVMEQAHEAEVTACFSKLDLSALETFIVNQKQFTKEKHTGHLLLVEDSLSAAMIYKAALTKLGFTFDHCIDAESAINRIQHQHYDLVILDFKLSGLRDGFSIIKDVRSSPHPISLTPILAMSGLNNPTRRAQLLMNGANDFYAKSSSIEEFKIRVLHLVTDYKHVQKLENQYKVMHDMATHDALTTLYNRHYLEMIKDSLISTANQTGEPLAMFVLDLDFFKKINDSYGHKVGDQVLVAYADALKNYFVKDTLIFRIGGEEFLVLLPNFSQAEANIKANELCFYIQQAHLCGLNLTTSIGVAIILASESYDQLFLRADAALNSAKQNGRNQAVFAP